MASLQVVVEERAHAVFRGGSSIRQLVFRHDGCYFFGRDCRIEKVFVPLTLAGECSHCESKGFGLFDDAPHKVVESNSSGFGQTGKERRGRGMIGRVGACLLLLFVEREELGIWIGADE